jgi:predicted site-specific integrase-resolvase
MRKGTKMLTPRQYAEKHQVAYTTVATWLQRGQIPDAVRIEAPAGGHLWAIPETAKAPQHQRGRPKKAEDAVPVKKKRRRVA